MGILWNRRIIFTLRRRAADGGERWENSKGCYEEGKIPICEKGRMERRDEIRFTFPEEKL